MYKFAEDGARSGTDFQPLPLHLAVATTPAGMMIAELNPDLRTITVTEGQTEEVRKLQ